MATLDVESMFVRSTDIRPIRPRVALKGGTRMESRRHANRPQSGGQIIRRCAPHPFGAALRALSVFFVSPGKVSDQPDEIFGDVSLHATDSNRAGATSLCFSTY